MHMHVVRNAKSADQIKHPRVVTEQMVQFDGMGPLTPEQAQQVRQFCRQDITQVRKRASGAVADLYTSCATWRMRRPEHNHSIPTSAMISCGGGDLALDAATPGMRDQNNRPVAATALGAPPCQIQTSPDLRQRIRLSEFLDQSGVAGM